MYIDNTHAERTSVVSETYYPRHDSSSRTQPADLRQVETEQYRVSVSRLPFGRDEYGRREGERLWLGERGGVNGRA